MTGRELILYILQNRLEDVDVNDKAFSEGFMTVLEAAAKFEVGTHTIMLWCDWGSLPCVKICDTRLILRDAPDPRPMHNKS